MGSIFEFILSFLVSPGIPEKRELNSVKIFMLIVFIIICINIVYDLFFE
jgi:hypothetical protein